MAGRMCRKAWSMSTFRAASCRKLSGFQHGKTDEFTENSDDQRHHASERGRPGSRTGPRVQGQSQQGHTRVRGGGAVDPGLARDR